MTLPWKNKGNRNGDKVVVVHGFWYGHTGRICRRLPNIRGGFIYIIKLDDPKMENLRIQCSPDELKGVL